MFRTTVFFVDLGSAGPYASVAANKRSYNDVRDVLSTSASSVDDRDSKRSKCAPVELAQRPRNMLDPPLLFEKHEVKLRICPTDLSFLSSK